MARDTDAEVDAALALMALVRARGNVIDETMEPCELWSTLAYNTSKVLLLACWGQLPEEGDQRIQFAAMYATALGDCLGHTIHRMPANVARATLQSFVGDLTLATGRPAAIQVAGITPGFDGGEHAPTQKETLQ